MKKYLLIIMAWIHPRNMWIYDTYYICILTLLYCQKAVTIYTFYIWKIYHLVHVSDPWELSEPSTYLIHSVRKDLTKNAYGQNHRSLWFTLESFSPIKEITKIYQLQIFSCLFTFYSHLSRICWKNKCYKKQVPSNFFTLLRCQEINFYAYFHNQLKKVWNVNFWGQNTDLSFHQISTF